MAIWGHPLCGWYPPSNEYIEGFEQMLPTESNFDVKPLGKILLEWLINSDGKLTIATESIPSEYSVGLTLPNGNIINDNATLISNTQAGNVKLVAAYNNLSYSITWNLGTNGETWASDYVVSTSYTYSEELTLPVASNIIASQRKELDYWIIKKNGIVIDNHATRIISGTYGNVEIVAR